MNQSYKNVCLWSAEYSQHSSRYFNLFIQVRDLYFAARTKYSDSWARVEEHIIAAEQEIMSSNRIAPIMNPVIINFTGDDSDSEFGGDDQVVSIPNSLSL